MGYHTVVVGYDGSSDADRAVEVAADLVDPAGTVHVVTAFRRETEAQLLRQLEQVPEEFRYRFDPDAAERERQQPALARLDARGVTSEGHVVPDSPAAAIIDVAQREGADLVVVGSRGLGGVQRFVRGSVSSRVAEHAPMSVLIVQEEQVPLPG